LDFKESVISLEIQAGAEQSIVNARVAELADAPDLGSGSERIRGSSPLARTNLLGKYENNRVSCTHFAQYSARPADRRVRFPVTIRHRAGKVKIYAPAKGFNYYRLSYVISGKRRMPAYRNYSEAKAATDRIVREIHKALQPQA
jgi:hypothetical protein